QHIKRKYNLLIGERTAELIKMGIGNAYPSDEVLTMDIKGRDLVAGVPRTLTVSSDEIRDALAEPVNAIVEAVKVTLERILPVLDLAKERLWGVYVGEIARCRKRVDELREKYPSATAQELAQRLTDSKKAWASTGGAVSGLFGLALVPADLIFVTVLQLTL